MNFSNGDLITVDEILSDVLSAVGDDGTKMRSKGWYTFQIKQALEELSFDTFFGEFHGEYDIPENLNMQIPTGAFNIIDIFGIGGNGCVISEPQKIYHKRGYINSKSGNGFTARNNGNNSGDPFHEGSNAHRRQQAIENMPGGLYFYNIQNGIIMFSESCRSLGRVRLVFNGVADDVAGAPLIPKFLRQAVKDWVTVEALKIKTQKSIGDQAEYSHWFRMLDRTENNMNKPYDGSMAKARKRVTQIDKGQRRDMNEYFKKLNY